MLRNNFSTTLGDETDGMLMPSLLLLAGMYQQASSFIPGRS